MLRYMFDLSKKRRKVGEQRFQESKYASLNSYEIGDIVVLKHNTLPGKNKDNEQN